MNFDSGTRYQLGLVSVLCKGDFMNSRYTAVIKRDGNWWIGWIEKLPGVNCQEDPLHRCEQ